MPKQTHHYSNGEVTIVWKPAVCIHSTLCWKGLNSVFQPSTRPWVKIDGASTDQIITQVKKCPSGALSYFLNHKTDNNNSEPTKAEAAANHPAQIEVTANGPYLVKTECLIRHSDGREEKKSGTVALCRCGSSQNKPYCDGSHGKSGFIG